MFDFLKTKNFHILFSFLIGIFIVIVWRPVCEKGDCIKHELPNLEEINSSTYQISSKCYQFRTNPINI
jgi:hypothetical protein